jgi:hypothetical protein
VTSAVEFAKRSMNELGSRFIENALASLITDSMKDDGIKPDVSLRGGTVDRESP